MSQYADDNLMVSGMYPKPKRDNAPDFVLSTVSINVAQFREWFKGYLSENPNEEWVNIQNLQSKGGKYYAKVDTWKPDPDKASAPANHPTGSLAPADDIPF